MKNIPSGRGALSIAHAGHELRLHRFIEIVKPYIFVMSEGEKIGGRDSRMKYSFRHLNDTVDEKDFMGIQTIQIAENKFQYINDLQIHDEILLGRTGFFGMYISMMIDRMKEKKVDYIVCDASESTDSIHEMCRIATDIAIKYIHKTTGKEIFNYEYSVNRKFDSDLTEDCVHIKLDNEAMNRKVINILNYHQSIFEDLKPDISLDMNVVSELRKTKQGMFELKKIIEEINPDFLSNEYIRPYIYKEPTERPLYEIKGEALLAQGNHTGAIQYEKHIKPLKKKLEILLGVQDLSPSEVS